MENEKTTSIVSKLNNSPHRSLIILGVAASLFIFCATAFRSDDPQEEAPKPPLNPQLAQIELRTPSQVISSQRHGVESQLEDAYQELQQLESQLEITLNKAKQLSMKIDHQREHFRKVMDRNHLELARVLEQQVEAQESYLQMKEAISPQDTQKRQALDLLAMEEEPELPPFDAPLLREQLVGQSYIATQATVKKMQDIATSDTLTTKRKLAEAQSQIDTLKSVLVTGEKSLKEEALGYLNQIEKRQNDIDTNMANFNFARITQKLNTINAMQDTLDRSLNAINIIAKNDSQDNILDTFERNALEKKQIFSVATRMIEDTQLSAFTVYLHRPLYKLKRLAE